LNAALPLTGLVLLGGMCRAVGSRVDSNVLGLGFDMLLRDDLVSGVLGFGLRIEEDLRRIKEGSGKTIWKHCWQHIVLWCEVSHQMASPSPSLNPRGTRGCKNIFLPAEDTEAGQKRVDRGERARYPVRLPRDYLARNLSLWQRTLKRERKGSW